MFSAHVRPARELTNNYAELSTILKKRDYVILTNDGKSEAVVIPFEDLASYEEFLHIRFVEEKLTEAEVIASTAFRKYTRNGAADFPPCFVGCS